MRIIAAPERAELSNQRISVFTGGSIELGKVRDWQNELIQWLGSKDFAEKLTVFNPRRPQWDPSWPVNDPNHAQLREQIEWELEHQDKADIPIYFFASNTMSPITLLEMGLYRHKKPIIMIEPEYMRQANVIVTAQYYGLEYYMDWNDFTNALARRIMGALQDRGV